MPIYEYDCAGCGARFERIQRISEPDPEACPTCQAPGPRRRISESAFHLKGSGWYVTDYARKGSGGKEAATDKAAEGAKPGEAAPKAGEGSTAGKEGSSAGKEGSTAGKEGSTAGGDKPGPGGGPSGGAGSTAAA